MVVSALRGCLTFVSFVAMLLRALKIRFPQYWLAPEQQMHRTFHENRAIFVHIPKAAGSSVCQALFGHQVGHYTIEEWRAMNPQAVRKYFTFSFVREPLDRLHSAFSYLRRGGMNKIDLMFAERNHLPRIDFAEFVERLAVEPQLQQWIHFRPQHEFIQAGDRTLVDFVGRFENLEADFAAVAKRLGRDIALPKLNKSEKPPVAFDAATKALARQIYEKDYQAFCY